MADEEIKVGTKVLLDRERPGVVRYVGNVDFGEGTWYGIELLSAVGKNDGSRGGKRYFYAGPKRGVFYQRDRIRKIITNRNSVMSLKYMTLIDPMVTLNKTPVGEWDNIAVCRWLNSIQLEGYMENFSDIDGKVLLRITPYELMTTYKMNVEADRFKIIKAIKELQVAEPAKIKDAGEEKTDGDKIADEPHARKPSTFNPDNPLATWSTDQVVRYVNGLGGKASDCGALFRKAEVTGAKLQFLTEDDMKDMGIKETGVRKKLLNSLQALME